MRSRFALTVITCAALIWAVSAGAATAQGKNEALAISPAAAGVDDRPVAYRIDSLRELGFETVETRTAQTPHDAAELIRQFLAAPGGQDDLRLVWVTSGRADVCPHADEDAVRPSVSAIVIAPACVKFLIQSPTAYERLDATFDNAPKAASSAGPPEVAFLVSQGETDVPTSDHADTALRSERCVGHQGSLINSILCRWCQPLIAYFSPAAASWSVNSDPSAADQSCRAVEGSKAGLPIDRPNVAYVDLITNRSIPSPLASESVVAPAALQKSRPDRGRSF